MSKWWISFLALFALFGWMLSYVQNELDQNTMSGQSDPVQTQAVPQWIDACGKMYYSPMPYPPPTVVPYGQPCGPSFPPSGYPAPEATATPAAYPVPELRPTRTPGPTKMALVP